MTAPLNASLQRARQSVPTFAGTMPDASTAQAHALIGIGEVLQQILVELQAQRQSRPVPSGRMSRRSGLTRASQSYDE